MCKDQTGNYHDDQQKEDCELETEAENMVVLQSGLHSGGGGRWGSLGGSFFLVLCVLRRILVQSGAYRETTELLERRVIIV